MQIPVDEIKVRDGRRELNIDYAHELSESVRELGLLNPITVDKEHFLIAGLHRLEAVKLLGWSEIECNECSLEGLQAELALFLKTHETENDDKAFIKRFAKVDPEEIIRRGDWITAQIKPLCVMPGSS